MNADNVAQTSMKMKQPNGLLCKLPGCGKALVGQQQMWCSDNHRTKASNYHKGAGGSPNGFLCKLPDCGEQLKGRQKHYCSRKHHTTTHYRKLGALMQTEGGRRMAQFRIKRLHSTIPHLSFKQRNFHKGIVLSLQSNICEDDTLLHVDEIISQRQKSTSLTKRLKNGGLLICPYCGSRRTKRTGGVGGWCYAEQRYWTLGKDYTKLICGICGSDDTKKGGYRKNGNPVGYCRAHKGQWTIGHDYGTPFTPAMVNLLHEARQTTLTAEEEAQIEEVLGSTC